MCRPLLTDDGCRQQSDGGVWGRTLREEGLQDVVGEGESDDRVTGGHDDDQRHPQVEERRQRAERKVDVRVVATALIDHRACSEVWS